MHRNLIPTRVLDPASPAFHLHGSVALVIGGGRGITRMVARRLAEAGAVVGLIGTPRSHEAVETARLVRAAGGVVQLQVADLGDAYSTVAAVGRLHDGLGISDVFVAPSELLHCVQFVLPDMVAEGRGRVIAITGQTGARRCRRFDSRDAVAEPILDIAGLHCDDGIRAFSVDPGLPPLGMSAHERRCGRGADHDRAAELIVRVAAGEADPLSGLHFTPATVCG